MESWGAQGRYLCAERKLTHIGTEKEREAVRRKDLAPDRSLDLYCNFTSVLRLLLVIKLMVQGVWTRYGGVNDHSRLTSRQFGAGKDNGHSLLSFGPERRMTRGSELGLTVRRKKATK